MNKRVLVFAALLLTAALTLTGCGRSDSQITADAKPLIEKIIRQNFGAIQQNLASDANCKRLIDIQKVDKNHYTAKAEVDIPSIDVSGKMLDVAITYDGDTVLVEIK